MDVIVPNSTVSRYKLAHIGETKLKRLKVQLLIASQYTQLRGIDGCLAPTCLALTDIWHLKCSGD